MSQPPRDYHNPPQPHFSAKGQPKTLDAEDIFRQYAPEGKVTEPVLSTGARVAHRLIDRETGKTYSADEMFNSVAQIDPSNTVAVAPGDSDLQRGEFLLAAYAAAKLLTPNGESLSATNRAQVLLPAGKYKLTASMILDTNFVDLVAQFPVPPQRRKPGDTDKAMGEAGNPIVINDLDSFRPGPTLIYTEVPKISTIRQNCEDVRLTGFSIAILSTGFLVNDDVLESVGALKIGDVDNSASVYQQMYFWNICVENFGGGGTATYRDFSGTWIECVGNGFSFVIGKGLFDAGFNNTDALDGKFRATMIDCEGGPFSFIGDGVELPGADNKATGARLTRCRVIGKWGDADTLNGRGGFGGCGAIGTDIDATCYLEDCHATFGCFGLGKTVAATFVRCTGGDYSFGSSGVFSGTATDCVGGNYSFGRATGAVVAPGGPKCSGTLIRCDAAGSEQAMQLEGATLRSCRFTVTTTGVDCFKLLDSNSSITDCEIIVVQGGTGIPINAASAKNVVAVQNRMNNAVTDADGLGANVTNLVSSAGNVVSNSIR